MSTYQAFYQGRNRHRTFQNEGSTRALERSALVVWSRYGSRWPRNFALSEVDDADSLPELRPRPSTAVRQCAGRQTPEGATVTRGNRRPTLSIPTKRRALTARVSLCF